jgi:hypothetical protein
MLVVRYIMGIALSRAALNFFNSDDAEAPTLTLLREKSY